MVAENRQPIRTEYFTLYAFTPYPDRTGAVAGVGNRPACAGSVGVRSFHGPGSLGGVMGVAALEPGRCAGWVEPIPGRCLAGAGLWPAADRLADLAQRTARAGLAGRQPVVSRPELLVGGGVDPVLSQKGGSRASAAQPGPESVCAVCLVWRLVRCRGGLRTRAAVSAQSAGPGVGGGYWRLFHWPPFWPPQAGPRHQPGKIH